ncbi:hypothetical protein BY458DRAFT_585526 [Sporodiniella umbellata]|nr:hypothetical protein BY458DRAFT_585526 [Sporodiniella umbellata]
MFSTSFTLESFKNVQKLSIGSRFEDTMELSYDLLHPGVSSINAGIESIANGKYKGFQLNDGNNSINLNANSIYSEGEGLLNSNTVAYDHQNMGFVPLIESRLTNDQVYEAFIYGGLDLLMAPQTNYSLIKDNLPSCTEPPSTITFGYNYDLDLTTGLDGQQYFNSGVTTSSLMCCTTQNAVSPEKSVSHLPELVSPDEFNSSDEDNTSAVDEQDFLFSKSKPNIQCIISKTNVNEETVATESSCRQVEHKDKKHQQTAEHKYLKKINSKPEYLCKSKTYNKKSRKNYEKEVISKLMSYYLIHNGKIPDGLTKSKICKDTGKSLVQVSTWFQNAKRRYSHKLEIYTFYSQKYPDLVYDSESLKAFLKSEKAHSQTCGYQPL